MTSSPADLALEKGGYGGVFFLHGDDEFRKEEYARALVEAHLDPSTRDFNNDLLRGSEVDLETLASVLGTPPMMAEWRVVLVREAEALSASSRTRDVLLQTAEKPPPGLALILLVTTDSKARFWKDLRDHARDVEFKAIEAVDTPPWLVERARAHGVVLEEDAARKLAAAIGTDLGVLAQEIEKLAGFVGDGGRITVEAVEAAGTRLPKQDLWQWLDMVGEKRFEEALQGLPLLLAQGESGVRLVIALGTQLLRIGVAAAGGRPALVAALPRHQQWLAKNILPQASHWSTEEVDEAVRGLLRVDRLLKASGVSDEALLEEWLLGLLARRQGVAA
ncbi:MAG: DNA polymerase III subunit delta [Gemmatimonadetes bacterium]|nr:DNA polymerase III subunit delta [Gemmatimonadota bacterium]